MNNKINKVVKAGGIIIKEENEKKYILLLYRGRENDWSFPKGHAEQGEKIEETVLREIKEEAGLNTEIIKELEPNIYINSKTKEETITYMYLLRPIDSELKIEHINDKLEWIPLDEVVDRLSYNNLKEYFSKIENEL